MLTPISVGKFADMVIQNNEGYQRKKLISDLRKTLEAKKNGAKLLYVVLLFGRQEVQLREVIFVLPVLLEKLMIAKIMK